MLKLLILMSVVSVLTVCRGAGSEDLKPESIVAHERAALDIWKLGDPQGFLDLYDANVTYFDPFLKKRMDGLEAMNKLYNAQKGKWTIPRYELIDPKVEVRGGMAVLSFNLVNYDAAGKPTSRWNATEVYVRAGGKLKIVHSHWSYTTPELKAGQTQ